MSNNEIGSELTIYRVTRVDGATIDHGGEIVHAFTLTDSSGSSLTIGVDQELLNAWTSLAIDMAATGLQA
jgi:hypothetical protein